MSQDGVLVAEAAIDAHGRFAIALPAGEGYVLELVGPEARAGLLFARAGGVVSPAFAIAEGNPAVDLGVVRGAGDVVEVARGHAPEGAGPDMKPEVPQAPAANPPAATAAGLAKACMKFPDSLVDAARAALPEHLVCDSASAEGCQIFLPAEAAVAERTLPSGASLCVGPAARPEGAGKPEGAGGDEAEEIEE